MKSKEMKPVAKGEYRTRGAYFKNVRPGSMDILKAPSRFGDSLFYPRGYDESKADQSITEKRNDTKANRSGGRNKR